MTTIYSDSGVRDEFGIINIHPCNVSMSNSNFYYCLNKIEEYIDGYMTGRVVRYEDKVLAASTIQTKTHVPSFWERIGRKIELIFNSNKKYDNCNDIETKTNKIIALLKYYKNNNCKVFLYQLGIDSDDNIFCSYGIIPK